MKSNEIDRLNDQPSPYDKASYFMGLVKQEIETCEDFLSKEEVESFRAYHSSLKGMNELRFSHSRDRYAQRVQHLIDSIDLKTKVLDAGCGTGSESILCSVLGANVIGVDLSEERLAVARGRLKFYEGKLNKPLEVKFYAQSVFDISDTFNVIWAQQSISHISPADRFIQFAYDHLDKGGKLIIIDPNALNPLAYILAKRDQWKRGGAYTTKRNPQTGEIIPYAQERIFSIYTIKQMVTKAGFKIKEVHVSGISLPVPLFSYKSRNMSYYINKVFDRLPIIRMFGGGYTLIVVKE